MKVCIRCRVAIKGSDTEVRVWWEDGDQRRGCMLGGGDREVSCRLEYEQILRFVSHVAF